jgi:flagellar biosynthesis/type III secretory pathway chaperone
MTTPAVRESQSLLEAALLDVHATLADLLAVADDQYAAVVAHDHARLEKVTRQQERLSTRLARAESKRIELLAGTPLASALASLPPHQSSHAWSLNDAIAATVSQLRERQTRTASLLEQSIELASQTIQFLQRLVTVHEPVYDVRGRTSQGGSLLLDGRA